MSEFCHHLSDCAPNHKDGSLLQALFMPVMNFTHHIVAHPLLNPRSSTRTQKKNAKANTKNDKAFALSGKVTHRYMKSEELTKPRITKQDIKSIILGGGHNLLSPERRFDAIIFNSPELFA